MHTPSRKISPTIPPTTPSPSLKHTFTHKFSSALTGFPPAPPESDYQAGRKQTSPIWSSGGEGERGVQPEPGEHLLHFFFSGEEA